MADRGSMAVHAQEAPQMAGVDNDYEVLELLGEGAFATVYKARHRRSNDLVAVKQIKLGTKSWHEACRSMELQALKSLRHPFIIRLRELLRSQLDGSLYYILEFIDSDLCHLAKQHPHGLEEQRAADVSRQLFAGLAHMHQNNFFHRDIKPENVLFHTASFSIRIADFGQARAVRALPPFTDYVGTRWYRAPECLVRDRAYSAPVDVWAAGLVFAELLRGQPVFCGTSSVDQLYKIFQVLGQPGHDWPEFANLASAMRFRVPEVTGCGWQRVLSMCSPDVLAIVGEVLVLSPRVRPPARNIVQHSFFSQLMPLDIQERELGMHNRQSFAAPGGAVQDLNHSDRAKSFGQLSNQQSGLAASPTSSAIHEDMHLPTMEQEPLPDFVAPAAPAKVQVTVDELDAELDRILSEADAPAISQATSMQMPEVQCAELENILREATQNA